MLGTRPEPPTPARHGKASPARPVPPLLQGAGVAWRQPQTPQPPWGWTGAAMREAGTVTGPPWCQNLLPDLTGTMQWGQQGPALADAVPASWEAVIYTNGPDYLCF